MTLITCVLCKSAGILHHLLHMLDEIALWGLQMMMMMMNSKYLNEIASHKV